jgi:signal transduction histidine kinase
MAPVSHFVTLLNDVSERKQAEKQAEALARTEKLRALGQIASGIAHDINQSLMLIASYGALGQRALDDDGSPEGDELRAMFTVVPQAAIDSGETVKRLLLLARAPLRETEPIDLTLLVGEVVRLTPPRWRSSSRRSPRRGFRMWPAGRARWMSSDPMPLTMRRSPSCAASWPSTTRARQRSTRSSRPCRCNPACQ